MGSVLSYGAAFCRERTDKSQNVPNWDRFTIVGTSQEIFKDYLRLTSVSFVFGCYVLSPR